MVKTGIGDVIEKVQRLVEPDVVLLLIIPFINSLFYLFSWAIAFFIPKVTEPALLLATESADERLDAEMNRVPSLDCRNRPLSRIARQRDWINEFSRNASNRTTTLRMCSTRIWKPSLQAKRASMSHTQAHKKDGKYWHKTQYLPSVHG